MAFLLDTNVLLRLSQRTDPAYAVADRAGVELHRRKEAVHVTAQNLIEFRNVATRPTVNNGLGLPLPAVDALAAGFEADFPLLADAADIFSAWKTLVVAAGVTGKRVHDARLIAVCHVYGISHLLTFNVSDFTSLGAIAPGVLIIDPASV